MDFKIEKSDGTARVVILESRIDVGNAERFKKILADCTKKGHYDVVVDLRNVEFMDSSGLGALVFGLREIKHRHGELKVSGLSKHVSSMFKVTRLDRIFKIV
ncbi:anti-anti-sigma factor [candidate division KSB1 bacterium]|nr:STAS domain-containing protein [bacterium]OQX57961.1 MAG: hypothetical protein B5M50_05095 [candidate division KSB1 bacterium 4484_219]RKY76824.1 MAG: anti-anti-sigma factor [candidate division KSB1 bacterium]HDI51023.1 anti-sigma factor antagonist [Bacteroidota bacterium]RKY77275.1 MAG: anti-anti-sigma factor [candidate division KSB1 bacterium]